MRNFQYPEKVRSFFTLLHRQTTKSVQLWCHKNADIDSFGAAIGLYYLLKTIRKDLQISIHVNSYSELTKACIDALGLNISLSDHLAIPKCDIVVIVDFNNPEMIYSEWGSLTAFKVIIDHHEKVSKEEIADIYISETKFVATCELLIALYVHAKILIPTFVANYLLAGILYDSQRLRRADHDLFIAIDLLLKRGGDYSKVLRILDRYPSLSERIARIKAAQRMKRINLGEFILLASYVHSYEASAARALLAIGGDIVLVVSERVDETRISVRATSHIIEKIGINVCNQICVPLAKKFGGTGGGHEGAGGVNLKRKVKYDQILDTVLQIFSKMDTLKK
ncbi:MAG: bifunctional oligoribonuclease/PAP phosphatase NrnA [Promethearchaeota archaeon]